MTDSGVIDIWDDSVRRQGGPAAVAQAVVDEEYRIVPQLQRFDSAEFRRKSLEDTESHLSYLAQSLSLQSETIFVEYARWTRKLLHNLGLPDSCLEGFFTAALRILPPFVAAAYRPDARRYLERALSAIKDQFEEEVSFIDRHNPLFDVLSAYMHHLQEGDRNSAVRLITATVAKGVPVKDIYRHVFQPFQYESGRLWHLNRLTVAEEHYYTATTQLCMSMLYERIFASQKNGYTAVATCVSGELHEIGIRMVADYFESSGWDTYYLGANMPPDEITAATKRQGAHLLAVSATLPTNVGKVAAIIRSAKAAIPDIRILVGGYPFLIDSDLWRRVEADAFASDFGQALEVAESLVTPVSGRTGTAEDDDNR